METQIGNDKQENAGLLNRSITRRQAIMAGGIAVVGLAFSKPLIETVMPKPAFADYVVGGRQSIEWRCLGLSALANGTSLAVVCDGKNPLDGDDLEVTAPKGSESVTVFATLCNVSSDASGFDAFVRFDGEFGSASSNFDEVAVEGKVLDVGESQKVGPFGDPTSCLTVRFDIALNQTDTKVKLRFKAIPEGWPSFLGGWLTITLEFDD